jgi:potassium channel subfamily K
MVTGVVVLMTVEELHFVTSVYVMMQIVTTVGYGDVTCESSAMKLFMSFYVLVSMLVVAGILVSGVELLLHKSQENFRKELKSLRTLSGVKVSQDPVRVCGSMEGVASGGVLFLLAITAGTVVFGVVENCTCSYGHTAIEGCDPQDCEATGGSTRSLLDALYLSCITLTTVGFGDQTPKSMFGRAFAAIWMLFGCTATGNFVSEFTQYIFEVKKKRRRFTGLSRDQFDAMDSDEDGKLSKFEFLTFVLVQYGVAKQEDVDEIMAQFEHLDHSGTGQIAYEHMDQHFSPLMTHGER